MIPLAPFAEWSDRLDEHAPRVLDGEELRAYRAIPPTERLTRLRAILEKPIAHFSPVNEVFFRARWAEVLELAGAPHPLTLLEIGSGDTDLIPQMMAHRYPGSRYITANMNRLLTAGLRASTAGLPLDIVVIEEDAAALDQHLAPGSVDLVAFQHAVNDVLQAILCDREGIDTIHSDWMQTLPAMIRILQRETSANTFAQSVRPAFLALLQKLLRILKEDGLIVANHYMFQLDLDWGYPPLLWEDLLPIVREWLPELPGCREVFFPGFDPQWWLFLQKG